MACVWLSTAMIPPRFVQQYRKWAAKFFFVPTVWFPDLNAERQKYKFKRENWTLFREFTSQSHEDVLFGTKRVPRMVKVLAVVLMTKEKYLQKFCTNANIHGLDFMSFISSRLLLEILVTDKQEANKHKTKEYWFGDNTFCWTYPREHLGLFGNSFQAHIYESRDPLAGHCRFVRAASSCRELIQSGTSFWKHRKEMDTSAFPRLLLIESTKPVSLILWTLLCYNCITSCTEVSSANLQCSGQKWNKGNKGCCCFLQPCCCGHMQLNWFSWLCRQIAKKNSKQTVAFLHC